MFSLSNFFFVFLNVFLSFPRTNHKTNIQLTIIFHRLITITLISLCISLRSHFSSGCSFNNGVCPIIKCTVAVLVSDQNERPKITPSTLAPPPTGHNVDEDKLPGYEIGEPLEAYDPEVFAGLQQLTWDVTECKAQLFGGTTQKTLTPEPGANLAANCPIKLSACNGQLSLGAGVNLNYESQTQYTLKVTATDDGGACGATPSGKKKEKNSSSSLHSCIPVIYTTLNCFLTFFL